VTIVAKDVDGFAILRDGERITVLLRIATAAGGGAGVQAEYDATAQRYRASFGELTTAGSYSISVQTPKGISERATFTLICAAGYAPADGGRCMQPRSPCETAVRSSSVASASSLQSLVVGDGFQVSNLGSACRDGRCSFGVAPFSKTMASFAVSNGQGAVRFNQTGQFEVRIMYGEGQQCTLPGSHAVACPKDRPIYSTEQGGTCVAQGSPCLDMNVTASGADARPGRDSALFTAGTRLSMSFPRSSQFFGSAASMEALLVPAEGTQVQMVTQDMLLSKPGGYTLQLRYDSGRQQCIRLSNLTVVCGVNEQTLNGQCVSTQTLCSQVKGNMNVSLSPNEASGLQSLFRADLTLPFGGTPFLTAVPQRSSLNVPMSNAAGSRVWRGSTNLPATGPWSLQVKIGEEQCTLG